MAIPDLPKLVFPMGEFTRNNAVYKDFLGLI
jgi:hypothetical protein